jgi:hypothetical protein
MAMQGKSLPVLVQQEFTDYLKWRRLEQGFLRGAPNGRKLQVGFRHSGVCRRSGAWMHRLRT